MNDLIDQLVEVGRSAVARGLVLASGGNLSARLPGGTEFVVTAAGTWLDRLTHDDFSVLDLDGRVVGGAPRPSTEWKLHQRTYRVRPDVRAVVHLHPQHAVLVDALGHPIRLLTLDHATYVRSVGTVPYFAIGLYKSGMEVTSVLFWRYWIALAVLIPLAWWTSPNLRAEWLGAGRRLRALLSEDVPEVLARAREALAGHEALSGLLEAALVAEPPLLARDGGFVAEGFDAELDETRRLRDQGRGVIAELQAEYQRRSGVGALKVKHNNVLGYFIETPAGHAERMMAPPLAELRATLSAPVPGVSGLSYRASAALAIGSAEAYAAGPVATNAGDVARAAVLVPVDRFRVFVGLRYDFFTGDHGK